MHKCFHILLLLLGILGRELPEKKDKWYSETREIGCNSPHLGFDTVSETWP